MLINKNLNLVILSNIFCCNIRPCHKMGVINGNQMKLVQNVKPCSKQSCYQIEIFSEFGILGAFDKYVEILCYFRSFSTFWYPVLPAGSVYVLYLQNRLAALGIIWKLFGAFLTNFEIAQNFLCYFLCYFLKNSEFGRTPEYREQVTVLFASVPPSKGE